MALFLLGATSPIAYLLSPAAVPTAPRALHSAPPVVAPRVLPPLMREHQAAEEAEDAAQDEEMLAAAEVARSAETLAACREAAAKRVAALGDDAAAVAMLEKGGAAPTGKMAKLLKKPKGTIALIGEGVRIDVVSMGGYDLDDPAYLSGEFRVGGCAAVSVIMTERDALKPDALAATAAEQETVRGDFPGPMPVLLRDDVIDPIQLAAAAAAGAKMALLSVALVGADGLAPLVAEANRLGLESVVRVGTEEEIDVALGAGAKMVCIGDVSTAQAEELLGKLPDDVVSVADFEARDVRGVWKVRDMGFNAIIIGKGLLDVCVRDRVPPAAVIKAMNSKGSVKFGLGMQKGRLEGSKENLGTIAM